MFLVYQTVLKVPLTNKFRYADSEHIAALLHTQYTFVLPPGAQIHQHSADFQSLQTLVLLDSQ